MLPLLLPLAAIAAGKGVFDIVGGAIGAGKAKRQQRELERNRPKYTTPQGELDMLSLLNSRAGQGLSDSTLQQYNQQAERGLSSGLDAIIKSGGTVNGASDLFQNYLGNIGNVQMANDQAQMQNINNYLNQQRRVDDYRDKEWDINTYAPWADKSAAAAQRRAQQEGRIQSGIGSVFNAATGVAGNLAGISQGNDLLGLGTNLLGQAVNKGISGLGNVFGSGNRTTPSTNPMSLSNKYLGGGNDFISTPSFGYDFSGLKPSDRSNLMSILGPQFGM